MKENVSLEKIGNLIEEHQHFLLISHVSPDGDAIGSMLALGHILEKLGKNVSYRNEDGVPSSLAFLPHSSAVQQPDTEVLDVEVVIALDCATQPRLGEKTLHQASGAKICINIDHHKTNTRYGDYNYIDSNSPATGQIIYNLCQALNYPITPEARDNIYVAVSTDTGSFRYRGTTQHTYAMAADLVEQGLNLAEINALTYEQSPLRKIKLLGEYLARLNVSSDGRIADWSLPMSVKEQLKIQADDSEDMINHIRAIEGVLIACSFEDLEDNKVRISLRSKTNLIDVSKIAAQFGGGGHAMAAGIRMQGPIENARQKVISALEQALVEQE